MPTALDSQCRFCQHFTLVPYSPDRPFPPIKDDGVYQIACNAAHNVDGPAPCPWYQSAWRSRGAT